MDRISNLPSAIVVNILEYLPIKEAVKTSCLSTKWRNKWTLVHKLEFDEQCVTAQNRATFASIVDGVLLLHMGPKEKFKLSSGTLPITAAKIDTWLRHLSSHSVKHLTLEIMQGLNPQQRYSLHSSLFACQEMSHLSLQNCEFRPQSTLKGFRSLETLELERVSLAKEDFANLIVGCPKLQSLSFKYFTEFSTVIISAPNLNFLIVDGHFNQLDLQGTLNLEYCCIALRSNERKDAGRDSVDNLTKFYVHILNVRKLKIMGCFIKFLSVGREDLSQLPLQLMHLSTLHIEVSFSDRMEFLTATCFMRSAHLEELHIWVHHDIQQGVGAVSLCLHEVNHVFRQLRRIKISSISAVRDDLDFIRFMLSSSPALELMTLKCSSEEAYANLIKEVCRLIWTCLVSGRNFLFGPIHLKCHLSNFYVDQMFCVGLYCDKLTTKKGRLSRNMIPDIIKKEYSTS